MAYRRVRASFQPEYIRPKEAMIMFSMSAEKIEELARECGAYYKIDKVVLLKIDALREYVESFREN